MLFMLCSLLNYKHALRINYLYAIKIKIAYCKKYILLIHRNGNSAGMTIIERPSVSQYLFLFKRLNKYLKL